jgi:hypothetical protein
MADTEYPENTQGGGDGELVFYNIAWILGAVPLMIPSISALIFLHHNYLLDYLYYGVSFFGVANLLPVATALAISVSWDERKKLTPDDAESTINQMDD